MPEATVNEYHLAAAWEYKIRLAGKISIVKTVSEPKGVNKMPDRQFRLRVLAADLAHAFGAL